MSRFLPVFQHKTPAFGVLGLSTSGVDRQPYVLWPSEAIADHNFTSTRARCSAITLATRFSRESNNATNRKRLHGTGRQCRRHRQSRHNKNALPGFARVLRSGSNVETSLARRNMALAGAVLAAIREAPNRSACLNTKFVCNYLCMFEVEIADESVSRIVL